MWSTFSSMFLEAIFYFFLSSGNSKTLFPYPHAQLFSIFLMIWRPTEENFSTLSATSIHVQVYVSLFSSLKKESRLAVSKSSFSHKSTPVNFLFSSCKLKVNFSRSPVAPIAKSNGQFLFLTLFALTVVFDKVEHS